MKALSLVLTVASALTIAACAGSLAKRDAQTYRTDTRALLTTHDQKFKSCYDQALAQDPSVAGIVVVNFKVMAKTGAIAEPAVDEAHTTAPASLTNCIVTNLEGLVLSPADKNEGRATFRWDFAPGS